MDRLRVARKVIADPGATARKFWDRVGRERYLELYRRSHRLKRQRRHIHEFVSNDEFALVVLDACRYDVFERLCPRYLSGRLENVWASGRWTAQYAERTWTGRYDLTYINSMPVNSDFYFDLKGRSHRPRTHIDDFVHVWEHGWDSALGTVPADVVTDTGLNYANRMDSTRLVVHYAQPHAPYIGTTKILPWSGPRSEDAGMRHLLYEDIDRPNQRIYRRIRSGDISDEELYRAYVHNLEYVLEEVVRLVRRLDCPVVITGDHGEHLGEKDRYLHEADSTLIRQVPWFVVSESEIGRREIESELCGTNMVSSAGDRTTAEIKDRLASLGYVE
jgi:hypothetical protein